jgi:hypothetical protein
MFLTLSMSRKKLSPANYDTVKAAIAKGIVVIPDAAPASALKLKKPVLLFSSATPHNLHQEENPRSHYDYDNSVLALSLSLHPALFSRSRRLSLPRFARSIGLEKKVVASSIQKGTKVTSKKNGNTRREKRGPKVVRWRKNGSV